MSNSEVLHQMLNRCVEVQDADEETFDLFSQPVPSANLGFVDAKATEVEIDVGPRSFFISQSLGLLHSDRAGGTTGAVIWKVTPLIAQWLVDKSNILWQSNILYPRAVLAELGCGIGGLIGVSLCNDVHQYILTDQQYVMKALRQNILANTRGKESKRSSDPSPSTPNNLHLLAFDWEEDSARNVLSILDRQSDGIDLLIACDCIYNDFLVIPFVEACRDTCELRVTDGTGPQSPTVLLVAQQQRSDEVFRRWLEETLKHFCVWRVSDEALPPELRGGQGYVVHLAVLKGHKP